MIYEGFVDKDIDNNELIDILSKIFDAHYQKIFITEDICDINLKLEDNIEIVCEKTAIQGEFLSKISIYLRSQNLKKKKLPESKIFEDICDSINCRCLISDDSYNPFTMILLDRGKKKY